MKAKKIVKNTTNRGTFNRAYKEYLERRGKIRCSYCKANRGENCKNSFYGSYDEFFDNKGIKHPNWKLVSKNRKQWMSKPKKMMAGINNRDKIVFIVISCE